MKMSNSRANCVYVKHNYLVQNLKSKIHQQILIPTINLLTKLNLHHLKTMAVPLSPNQKPEVGAVNQGTKATEGNSHEICQLNNASMKFLNNKGNVRFAMLLSKKYH